MGHRPVQGRARGRREGQGGRGDRRAGPRAGGGALGGAAAAGAVVDVPDQFAAQGGAQQQLVVSGEAGDAGAGARLHDGEGGAGAFHLAGGGGEQLPGEPRFRAQRGGDLSGRQLMPYGQLQRLALLGRRAGGLRPGQERELAAALRLDLLGRGLFDVRDFGVRPARGVRPLSAALRLRQGPQARPARERVQPRLTVALGFGTAGAAAFGERQGVAQRRDGVVVIAQDGQAVREQAVQIRLVARGRALGDGPRRRSPAPVAVRPVCAGGLRGRFRPAGHHPCDRRRMVPHPSSPLGTFNPYG